MRTLTNTSRFMPPTALAAPAVLVALSVALTSPTGACAEPAAKGEIQIAESQLRDKIRGGMLGQILGNLNGRKHEMRYIDKPGGVDQYTPALPEGAVTDDDTDFEWVYIVEMQRRNAILLPRREIARLWRERINRRIWCSNQYARQLMDLGLEPPLTGRVVLNPWAEFNISGQFLCETFGLLAPAMPETAARIGCHYTSVAVDREPLQTTQLFTAMIATAFVERDIDRILAAGLAAIDSDSQLREIVADLRRWRGQFPNDWRAARRLVKQKYTRHGGATRDRNGYELNTAATVAALLYGRGELAETLRMAFNFGWDADNTAATAGTIVGVIHGYRQLMANEWKIVDRYRNTTRDQMPLDETITSFADRVAELAERVIRENGGRRKIVDGRPVFMIQSETPRCVSPLPTSDTQLAEIRSELRKKIEDDLAAEDKQRRARAAYLAICLDLAQDLADRRPDQWKAAARALLSYDNVVQAIYFYCDVPGGETIRRRAAAAGVQKPESKRRLW